MTGRQAFVRILLVTGLACLAGVGLGQLEPSDPLFRVNSRDVVIGTISNNWTISTPSFPVNVRVADAPGSTVQLGQAFWVCCEDKLWHRAP